MFHLICWHFRASAAFEYATQTFYPFYPFYITTLISLSQFNRLFAYFFLFSSEGCLRPSQFLHTRLVINTENLKTRCFFFRFSSNLIGNYGFSYFIFFFSVNYNSFIHISFIQVVYALRIWKPFKSINIVQLIQTSFHFNLDLHDINELKYNNNTNMSVVYTLIQNHIFLDLELTQFHLVLKWINTRFESRSNLSDSKWVGQRVVYVQKL